MLNFVDNSIDVLTIGAFQINKNRKETVVFLCLRCRVPDKCPYLSSRLSRRG